jgi:hypothetical protein
VDAIVERPFLLYAALALLAVALPAPRARALAGMGLAIAALGLAADSMGGPSSGTGFATTNEVLMGLGAAVVILAAVLAWRFRPAAIVPAAIRLARPRPDPLLLLGLLFAAAGPHLILVAAGIFLVLLSAARVAVLGRFRAWLALVVFDAALLVTALFLLFTILGPSGGGMASIASGPFSPAAERHLVLLVGLASLSLSGLLPFHRAPWRLSLAPLAAILLSRVLAAGLPEGLGDWESPAMLWLVAAMAYGAFSGRWSAAMVAGGMITLWSGLTAGIFPGCLLVLWGWLDDAGLTDPARLGADARRWNGLKALVPALAAPFALAAALSAEVVLSVLGVAAISLALAVEAGRRSRPA